MLGEYIGRLYARGFFFLRGSMKLRVEVSLGINENVADTPVNCFWCLDRQTDRRNVGTFDSTDLDGFTQPI